MTKNVIMGRKRCGKRRNCSLRAISPFPTLFSKYLYYRHAETRACLGKGKGIFSTQNEPPNYLLFSYRNKSQAI